MPRNLPPRPSPHSVLSTQCSVLLVLLVSAGLLFASPAGGGAAQEEPGVYRATLPNGILVVTRERPNAEVAAISVFLRGGSRDEDPATIGAAHFMEHMYFQGTPLRPNQGVVSAPIQERGGWLNASTGWEGIGFQATVPNHAFDVALDVVADILVNSTFPASAVDKERQVVLEELNRRLNDPLVAAFDLFAETVFANHPTRQLPIGNRTTLNNTTRETLVQFRDRFFRASNMVVAVVGNLRHEEVEAKVAAAFAGMASGPPPVWTPAPRPATERRVERRSVGARQAQVMLGWITSGYDSPDRYVFDVLTAALGSGGQRLAADLRDRQGLVTRVEPYNWTMTDIGTWMILVASEPTRVDAAVAGILAEVRRLRDEPLSATELAEAQAYVRGSRRRDLERSVDQANDLAEGIALGYYEPIDSYLARIAAVTPADVQRVARAYLDPDTYTLVVLGP
jgi:zinc protease